VKSKISKDQRDGIIKICQQMKPEERLMAFFNHSSLVTQIHQAGIDFRKTPKRFTINKIRKKS